MKSRLLGAVCVCFISSLSTAANAALVNSLTVSGTNPNPVYSSTALIVGQDYTLEASGTYAWGGTNNYADAGYATENNWGTLRTDVGIRATTPEPQSGAIALGVTSLLVDLGSGIQIVDWGDYNNAHTYSFTFTAYSSTIGFVISDWWSDWYGSFCQFQSCMHDNFGELSVDIYSASPVPIPPALYLFGTGLLGLVGFARSKAATL